MKTEILVDFQICIRVPLNALSQMFMERKIWNFLSKSQPYSYHNLAEACNFIKKESLAQVFSCEFCKISKNTFFYGIPPVAASEIRIDDVQNL